MTTKKDSKGRNLRSGEDQLKDGRYRYRYTDRYGKRRTVYSWKLVSTDKIPKGKEDDICLREKEKQVLRDLDDGIQIDKVNMTLNDLMQTYFSLKHNISVTTKNNYIHIWEKNIKNSTLGQMKIGKICKSDILKFYSYLYTEKDFKVGTLQLYQNILYPCFQIAVEDNIIRHNPCTGCMKGYVHDSESTRQPLTRTEQSILLKFLKNDATYYPMYSLVACMLGTGFRIGEVLGLTWDDINFEEKYIKLDHQVLYKRNTADNKGEKSKIQFFIDKPKNNSVRIVPIKDDLIHILKVHKSETYFMSKISDFEVDGYKEFVFINREGKLRTPGTVRRSFIGMTKAYNKKEEHLAHDEKREPILLPEFSPHILRHTYCTRMAENGIDVKVLQELMGHKNISITMEVYNHSDLERAQKEIKKIESVINL